MVQTGGFPWWVSRPPPVWQTRRDRIKRRITDYPTQSQRQGGTMTETIVPGSNRLTVLAAEIRDAHAAAGAAAVTRARRAIDAGRALIEAKELLKHGQWLPWLRQHCRLPERTAQLYMKLVENTDILGPDAAAALIAARGMQNVAIDGPPQIIRLPDYDPFANCDDEQRRQWLLFALFLHNWSHVKWLLRKGYVSPDEWLADDAQRRRWHMTEAPESCRQRWVAFQRQYAETTAEAIEAELRKGDAAAA
jgi:hypothetical protein